MGNGSKVESMPRREGKPMVMMIGPECVLVGRGQHFGKPQVLLDVIRPVRPMYHGQGRLAGISPTAAVRSDLCLGCIGTSGLDGVWRVIRRLIGGIPRSILTGRSRISDAR